MLLLNAIAISTTFIFPDVWDEGFRDTDHTKLVHAGDCSELLHGCQFYVSQEIYTGIVNNSKDALKQETFTEQNTIL